MLNDDLVELFYLYNEEEKINKEIQILKNKKLDTKEYIEELKAKIIQGLTDSNHKYAKYKTMDVVLKDKPEKVKMDKDELCDLIERIIDMDIDTHEKREKIFSSMKPIETGKVKKVLAIKINKPKKDDDSSDEE